MTNATVRRADTVWPVPGTASFTLGGALRTSRRGAALPIAVTAAGAPSPAGSSEQVAVTLASHSAAARAHVSGVLFQVRRTSASAAGFGVALDYSRFADAGGGGFGQRLHLVSLPACALSTPSVPRCQVQTPITTTNDRRTRRLSTVVGTTPTAGRSPRSSGMRPARASVASTAGSAQVMAAVAGPSGPDGSFTASSLAPSGSWSASGGSGSFDWSYPIPVPPSTASDVAPSVALSYDSGSVDGRIASTNDQSSWIGAGWDYSPGFIERTYRSCADDTSLPAAAQTGDQCWAGQVVTMSLGGGSSALVYDDSSHSWHPQRDDGSRVELVGAGSDGYQGEYWRVTTTDGVQYYFGKGILPGGSSATDTHSAWTEPVYGAHPGQPCYHSAGFGQSACSQAWRWNLDYVVDPHGNATTYQYQAETNYYGQNNKTTNTTADDLYTRGGYLKEIDYGLRRSGSPASIYATPASDRVTFTVAERCVPTKTVTCDPAQFTAANKDAWPDTPQDQQCSSGTVCNNHAPSFWTTKRLSSITTSYLSSGSNYQVVDSYSLSQNYPGGGDQEMDLASITRTATAADGSTTPVAPVSFGYQLLDNRVHGYNAQPEMLHERLTQLTTETGEVISVSYDQAGRSAAQCTASTVPTTPSKDTSECYPVYWTPPFNSTPILDYFHKHMVTEVDLSDGDTSDPNALAPTRKTTYTYVGAPAWHFDDNEVVKPANRTYGQFRGYTQVQTRTGDPQHSSNGVPDAWTLSTATYYRGMDGDQLPGDQTRTATVTDSLGETVPDGAPYAGTAREVQVFNGDTAKRTSSTITTPEVVAKTASRARTGLPALTAGMLGTADVRDYTDLAAGGTRMTQTRYTYDKDTGEQVQASDTGTNVSPVCTTKIYDDNTGAWIRDRVKDTITSAAACPAASDPPTAPTPIVREARSTFDSTGNPTETDSATTSDHWSKATFTYDSTGRPATTNVTAASGDVRTTSVAYTPAEGGPATKVVTTNALSQTTTTLLDPARGATVKSVDVAGHVTEAAYDALGRTTAVWRPGQTKGTDPASTTFSYLFGPKAPLAVTTRTLVDPGDHTTPSYLTSIDIYDAYGTMRQSQTDAVGGGRAVADSYTDAHGWTVATNNHWVTTGTPSTSVVATNQSGIDDSTRTAYDGEGRTTSTTEYRGTTATWSTRTYYGGDRTTVVPPAGGVEATTVTDARGNTAELDEWTTAPQITGDVPSGGVASRTTYGYDVLNRQTAMTTAAGSSSAATWTTSYDLGGRAVSQNDPDTGAATTTYDDTGAVLTRTSARGQTLGYTYDALGRKTGQYLNRGTTSTQLAGWTYDTVQAGQPATSTRYTPNGNFVTSVTGYDGAGRPLGSTLALPSSMTGFAPSYTTRTTYTSTGLVASVTPADGGSLPSETIAYHYDSHGDQTSNAGYNTYVSASTYDAFGSPTRYTLGVNNQTAWLSTSYDPQTRRVSNSLLSSQSATIPQLENVAYTYDPAGNPIRSVDTQGGGTGAPVQTTCYAYTALDQLQEAWSATDNCASDPAGTNSSAKVGGPQPFWHTWTFDAAGGRLGQVVHATPGGASADTTTAYSNGATQPDAHAHAVASLTTTGAGTTAMPLGTTAYGWDADGNATSVTGPNGSRTLTYTPDDRTATVTTAGGTVTYTYDAQGTQLLRDDPDSTTLYLPGEELVRTKSTGVVSGTRFYGHNGTTVSERVDRGNPVYLFSDSHGTTDTAVPTTQSGTGTPIRRHVDPYGNALGTTSGGTWPDQHGFLGKPADPATGLSDVGARTYDSALGRFLSVDPVLDANSPEQTNGYGYANNNPVTQSDPAGTDPAGPCSAFDPRRCSTGNPLLTGCGSATSCEHDNPPDPGCGSANACEHDNPPADSCGSANACEHDHPSAPAPACQSDAQCSRPLIPPSYPTNPADILQLYTNQCSGDSVCIRHRAVNGCSILIGNKSFCADMMNTTDDIIQMIYDRLYDNADSMSLSQLLAIVSVGTGGLAFVAAASGAEPLAAALEGVSVLSGAAGTVLDCQKAADKICVLDITATSLAVVGFGFNRAAAFAARGEAATEKAIAAAIARGEAVERAAEGIPSVSSTFDLLDKVFGSYALGAGGAALGVTEYYDIKDRVSP